MHVSDLALTDFRSYESVVLSLERGITAFVGPNGQGKTNLVEAIAYLSTFSSHRVAGDTALRAGGAGAHEGRITGDAVGAERGQVCDRLNEVGLALAVGAHEGGDARLEGENNVFVRPEVRQGEVRYIHHSSAGLTACPPNWFRSAAMAFIAGESSCRETKRAYREALMTGVGTA